jgi:hypothetical protein
MTLYGVPSMTAVPFRGALTDHPLGCEPPVHDEVPMAGDARFEIRPVVRMTA